MLDTLVKQLGRELNMEDLIVTQEPGHFSFPFDDNIKVDAIQFPQNIVLKGTIELLPSNNTEMFLEKTMEANLFGKGTRGAAIGLDPEGKTLTLTMDVDNNSNYKNFHEKMEDFVTMIDYWRKEAKK